MIILNVSTSRFEFGKFGRKYIVGRTQNEDFELAAVAQARQVDPYTLAQRVEINGTQRMVLIDRQVLRTPSRWVVV